MAIASKKVKGESVDLVQIEQEVMEQKTETATYDQCFEEDKDMSAKSATAMQRKAARRGKGKEEKKDSNNKVPDSTPNGHRDGDEKYTSGKSSHKLERKPTRRGSGKEEKKDSRNSEEEDKDMNGKSAMKKEMKPTRSGTVKKKDTSKDSSNVEENTPSGHQKEGKQGKKPAMRGKGKIVCNENDEPEKEEPDEKRIKKETVNCKENKRIVRRRQEAAKEGSKEEITGVKEVKPEVKKPTKKAKKEEDAPVPRPTEYKSLGTGPPPIPSTGCKYMGSHVSAAGGIWNAFENARECSSKSFALFLRNQRQWNAKALDDNTVQKWKDAAKDFPPHLILPHGSYLMNLGSPSPETLEKSRAMLVDEMQRCQRLGVPHYNFHPGSTIGKMSRVECCKVIAESINIAHSKTEGVICVLENMSCQGFTIGGDLHELRLIIEHVKDKTRVGVCIDTCHSHAAGYDLSTQEGFDELIQDFEKIIGWQFLRGLHINDSKGKAGDHLDRHENIGKGTIGLEGFRRVMNCDHFNDLPLILETPWTSNAGYAGEVKKLEGIIVKKKNKK